MDILTVASTVTMSSSATATGQQPASQVEGTAPFQQQLNQYVNQTEASTSTTEAQATTETAVVSEVQTELSELSTEQLVVLIEQLIGQLEELSDAPLTEEDQAELDMISMQLLALMQLITVDTKEHMVTEGALTDLQAALPTAHKQVNNELLFKLQDQLLLLQQSLTDGNLKVVQGQQPEQLAANVVQQLKQALTETKANTKEQLVKDLTSQGAKIEGTTSLHEASLEQLKQLAKQSEYAQLGNQVQSTPTVSTTTQTVEPVNLINLQQAISVNQPFTQTVSMLKAQPQAPAFTMINQFAETVENMVLQKFDLTRLSGLSEARIMLTPEHLGGVDIKLSMQNGILTAVFQAETASAKDALENQMAILRSALAAQGITVERLEVTQAAFASELTWHEQRHEQQTAQQFEDEQLNDDSFEEELESNTVLEDLGYGRAVNEMV